jgi:glutaredoxin
MTSLISRLWRPTPRAESLAFTVYTRTQCCCCHKAIDVLKEAQERYGFALEQVDVDSDPALVARFDTDVPVVTLNGKVRFKGVVNPALLERLILAQIQDRSATEEPDSTGA